MKTNMRFGATLKCDAPGCPATFVTYSMSSLVRKQALLAGWARLPASQVSFDGGAHGSSKQKLDLCPEHKPRPAMEGARP